MKFTTGVLALFAVGSLTNCNQIAATFNEPISSDYNPLDGPSVQRSSNVQTAGNRPSYNPGQWIETIMPNSTFFVRFPKGNATADQILPLGTPLKVVSFKDSFVKVELESGYVGYVPQIMVGQNSLAEDNSPFLPGVAAPQPITPLAPTPAPAIPDAQAGALNTSGDSLIPAPSSFTTEESTPLIEVPNPSANPNEVLIPTSPAPTPPSAPSTTEGIVPAPTADTIQPSIGIE